MNLTHEDLSAIAEIVNTNQKNFFQAQKLTLENVERTLENIQLTLTHIFPTLEAIENTFLNIYNKQEGNPDVLKRLQQDLSSLRATVILHCKQINDLS